MSDMKRLNRMGPRTDAWGTPAFVCLALEKALFISNLNVWFSRYELIRKVMVGGILARYSLTIRASCQTLLNVLATSNKTTPVDFFFC